MQKKFKYIAVLLLLLVFFKINWGTNGYKNTPAEESIIGQWLRYDTLSKDMVELSIQSNGFTVSSVVDTVNKAMGVYSIDNSRIFLQDNRCDSIIGIYDFEFHSADTLIFTVHSDACEYSRKAVMNGNWIKK